MRDINAIDLRLIDTTLLLVFLGVMRHRQATAVAREMGLTQPAVSYALKRLRALYDDPLFLRRAHGLEPTAVARELEPKVRRIVRLLSETFDEREEFDPGNTTINMRIAAFDYELTSILPKLVAELQRVSPSIGLHAFPLSNQEALDALHRGQIDLALGYFDFPTGSSKTLVIEKLLTERYVMAARRGHPSLSGDLSIEEFALAKHLLVSPSGLVPDMVDHALQLRGFQRSVQTTVPSLFAALSIVENSELIVTLPSRAAQENASRFLIAHRPLPIDGGTFDLHVVRHIRDEQSAVHSWVIGKIKSLVV
ncbi:MAG: LysR family transcriptional regulator [Pseudomonadota bacterium]